MTGLKENGVLKQLIIPMFVILNFASFFAWSPSLYELLKTNLISTYFYVAFTSFIAIYLCLRNKLTISPIALLMFFVVSSFLLFSNFISGFTGTFKNSMDVFVIMLYIFVFYGLMGSSSINEKGLKCFAHTILYFAVYACIYNIYINAHQIIKVFTTVSVVGGYEYNLCSFFPGRNNFGAFLTTAIASYSLLGRDRVKKINLCILALLIFNLFLTFSRTAILAAIMFYLIYYFLVTKNKIKYVITAFIVFVLVFIVIQYTGILSLILNVVIRANYGDSQRLQVWKQGLEVFNKNNILFGSGFNGAATKMGMEFHNGFIFVLASGGLLLFIPFIGFLGYVFFINLKIRKANLSIGSIFIGFLCIYIINSTAEAFAIFYSGSSDFIYTIMVGLLPIYYWNSIKQQKLKATENSRGGLDLCQT